MQNPLNLNCVIRDYNLVTNQIIFMYFTYSGIAIDDGVQSEELSDVALYRKVGKVDVLDNYIKSNYYRVLCDISITITLY